MDRDDTDTPARRVRRILGNSAFERISGPLRQTSLLTTTSGGTASNLQPAEELAHAFPSLYRPANMASSSTTSATQSRAYPYNPYRAYGPGSAGRRSGRSRPSPYHTVPAVQQSKVLKNFTKTVVLVEPEVDTVPKGRRRQQAYDDGCVVDMMEFRGEWTEKDVIGAIEDAFDKVLAPGPSPKYQYMKSCYGELKVPNVPSTHSWTPDKVKALCVSGDLYIRAFNPLIFDEQSSSDGRNKPPAGCSQKSSCDDKGQSTSDLQRLCEMFPNTDKEHLQSQLVGRSLQEAILLLIDGGDCDDDTPESSSPGICTPGPSSSVTEYLPGPSSSMYVSGPSSSMYVPGPSMAGPSSTPESLISNQCSLNELLNSFATAIIEEYDTWISAEKNKIWSRALQFYKSAKMKEKRLRGSLCVEYVDDDGVDAGALRGDFFEKLIKELDSELFEGDAFKRLPKKDGGKEHLFEIGGMMVAHSVIQGGPSLGCLNPAMYQYLFTDSVEDTVLACPLVVDDIPINAGTWDLISFIRKVDEAQDDNTLNDIVDEPTNMAIVNSSTWPVTKEINSATKMELMQTLIVEEVITKRDMNIRAFRKGLFVLGFLNLCRDHMDLTKPLFVHVNEDLTTEKFLALMDTTVLPPDPVAEPKRAAAYDFFHMYVREKGNADRTGNVTLPRILKFITGQFSVPPRGLKCKIRLDYHRNLNRLPIAECCFSLIVLPTIHDSFEEFAQNMDEGMIGAGDRFLRE